MPRHWITGPSPCGLLLRAALLGVALLLATAIPAHPLRAAEDFGTREPGRHVYDRAGLLTPDEIADLEARAAAVEGDGAPVVVYLRARDADQDETEDDARALMDAWDIQSAPGAHDGLVIFLNLKPNDLRHGQAALWAGARHTDGGNLPQYELRRIYDDVMRPALRDGATAAGIGAGLDAVANNLIAGPQPPPEPSAAQRFARTAAGLPLNLLAALGAGLLALLTARTWGRRPAAAGAAAPTLHRPGDLAPAIVGALVARGVTIGPLAEATLLDLARRGALAIEPEGQKHVRARLLDPAVPRTPSERALWARLADGADAEGVVGWKQLGQLKKDWKPVEAALRGELAARGWFAPDTSASTGPLYIGGTVALVAALVALALAAIGQQGWGGLAAALLGGSGIAAIILAASYPQTTRAGEEAALPWHGYAAGLRAAARDRNQPLDLDAALPDVIALGAAAAFDRRLKEASEGGYMPAWFARQPQGGESFVAFYPYWIAFHANVSPSSTSSAGSSASAGGAGAGGSF